MVVYPGLVLPTRNPRTFVCLCITVDCCATVLCNIPAKNFTPGSRLLLHTTSYLLSSPYTLVSSQRRRFSVQNIATDEESLKQANSLIMLLKADVRALNACAARLLVPSEAETVAERPSSEVARRYSTNVYVQDLSLLK